MLVALGGSEAEIVEIFESRVVFELGDVEDGAFLRVGVGGEDLELLGGWGVDEEDFLVGADELIDGRGVGEFVGGLIQVEKCLNAVEDVVFLLAHI